MCTLVLLPIEEYIKIIKQQSELSKATLFLPKLINNFYTF